MKTIQIFDIHPLFEAVQLNRIFPDGKTFVDCTPKEPLEAIATYYAIEKDKVDFDLKTFVLNFFDLPISPSVNYDNTNKSIQDNIESLWQVLTRQPDKAQGSLIPLPHSYIVPGGRFGEVYYWDSYFTMLGLAASGKVDMIENIINNFSHLIDTIGYIPNGNRSYYIGRSQPPFYALMVQLLADIKGEEVLVKYRPYLEKEYQFWIKGGEALSKNGEKINRLIKMPNGTVLNRYFDAHDTPRPESYREDVELAHNSTQNPQILFKHLRAGAESGWDYSCRWFKDENAFDTLHTTDIVPVDLNCLLYFLEKTIAKAFKVEKNREGVLIYETLAERRKHNVVEYFWSYERDFFFDYDSETQDRKKTMTLAGVFPLFFKIATKTQAKYVALAIETQFLKTGGLTTTLKKTGQQWDAPNGWAPLQWITIIGLENYGYSTLAKDIAHRWIKLNTDVYNRTGKLMEKYNVIDTHLEAGGGEYTGQDGFGWTNGVLLALMKKYPY